MVFIRYGKGLSSFPSSWEGEGYEFQNVGGILCIKALGDASSTVTEKWEGMNGVAGDVVALVVES